MTVLAQKPRGFHARRDDVAMSDPFLKMVPAIAANEQTISARIVRSSNPNNIGKMIISPAFYELYLVNESEFDVARIDLARSTFRGEGDSPIELKRFTTKFGELKRGRALLIEQLDVEGLDSVIRYDLEMRFTDKSRQKATFQISKATVFLEGAYRYFPALNTEAHAFSLKAA
jgi:hypothetical protein